MNRLKSWWHGQVTIEETPYVNFTTVKKPWLRLMYEKHGAAIADDIRTMARAIIIALVIK